MEKKIPTSIFLKPPATLVVEDGQSSNCLPVRHPASLFCTTSGVDVSHTHNHTTMPAAAALSSSSVLLSFFLYSIASWLPLEITDENLGTTFG